MLANSGTYLVTVKRVEAWKSSPSNESYIKNFVLKDLENKILVALIQAILQFSYSRKKFVFHDLILPKK